tara:strand:+ start:804 stop:1697 length:894 start_codon:yes stop_codon:yes gene_type:complete
VEDKIKKISNNLKSKFYFNHDTSRNVWFKAGGRALVYCLVYDENELQIILNKIDDIPYEIIGAGSNILIRDSGFKGILFKLGKNFNNINLNENFLQVGAGILDINLAKYAQINSIKDFEFLSGIPGTVGGAVKMNAGCYGKEIKDIIREIKTINSNGEFNILNKNQINLSYRNSSVPLGDIIISANFFYSYGKKEEIDNKLKEIKTKRENSQPLRLKTSGSTFKNPKNHFAAELIENAGCKGLNVGDVYVSHKHANFLINTNKAKAIQIEELGNRIIDKVYDKFKVKLEWEIKIIGN